MPKRGGIVLLAVSLLLSSAWSGSFAEPEGASAAPAKAESIAGPVAAENAAGSAAAENAAEPAPVTGSAAQSPAAAGSTVGPAAQAAGNLPAAEASSDNNAALESDAAMRADLMRAHDLITELESQWSAQPAPAANPPLNPPQRQPLQLRPAMALEPVAEPVLDNAVLAAPALSAQPMPKPQAAKKAAAAKPAPGLQSLEYHPSPKQWADLDAPGLDASGGARDLAAVRPADAPDKAATPAPKTVKQKAVVYYTPLPAIAVIPVNKVGNTHAFNDLPILFSKQVTLAFEDKSPQTRVLNPGELKALLRSKGLDYQMDKILKDYRYTGRPNPTALAFLLRQLERPDEPISRAIFVEADLDIANPMDPKGFGGIMDKVRSVVDGSTPSHMKYYVRSNVQVFDTEAPDMPRVWHFTWRRAVRADHFNNMTVSVFQDTDSQQAFTAASQFLTKEMFLLMPKTAYMEEHVDTSVQGQLAGAGGAPGRPAATEAGMHPVSLNGVADESGRLDPESEQPVLKERAVKPRRPVSESARGALYRMLK